MDLYSLNQTQMAERIGIKQTNLCEMFKGKRACGKGIMAKVQIAFPEINPKWLYHDTGPMRKENVLDPTLYCDYEEDEEETEETVVEVEAVERAPILSATLARAPQVDVLEAVSEKADELEKAPVGVFNAPVSVWYRVQDESLAPKYEVGDLLALWAYPKGEEDPIPGKMYGINTSTNGLIVRRLFPQEDGGYIAKAANREEFPDYRIKPGNVVQIYKIMLMVRF